MARKLAKELQARLEAFHAEASALSSLLADELADAQEAFDEMSEKVQEGERGQALQEHIDNVQELEDAIDNLESDLSRWV